MSEVQNTSGVSVRCQFPTWCTLLTLALRLFPILGTADPVVTISSCLGTILSGQYVQTPSAVLQMLQMHS